MFAGILLLIVPLQGPVYPAWRASRVAGIWSVRPARNLFAAGEGLSLVQRIVRRYVLILSVIVVPAKIVRIAPGIAGHCAGTEPVITPRLKIVTPVMPIAGGAHGMSAPAGLVMAPAARPAALREPVTVWFGVRI